MKILFLILFFLIFIYFSFEKLTSIFIDPNCLHITKKDLVDQFGSETILKEIMYNSNLKNYTISDTTAPMIASHLIKNGHSFTGNCYYF